MNTHDLYATDSTDVRIVLDLAHALHNAISDSPVIRWDAQQEAYDYYCAHGSDACIERTLKLRKGIRFIGS